MGEPGSTHFQLERVLLLWIIMKTSNAHGSSNGKVGWEHETTYPKRVPIQGPGSLWDLLTFWVPIKIGIQKPALWVTTC